MRAVASRGQALRGSRARQFAVALVLASAGLGLLLVECFGASSVDPAPSAAREARAARDLDPPPADAPLGPQTTTAAAGEPNEAAAVATPARTVDHVREVSIQVLGLGEEQGHGSESWTKSDARDAVEYEPRHSAPALSAGAGARGRLRDAVPSSAAGAAFH